jgi:hypothetical protein
MMPSCWFSLFYSHSSGGQSDGDHAPVNAPPMACDIGFRWKSRSSEDALSGPAGMKRAA